MNDECLENDYEWIEEIKAAELTNYEIVSLVVEKGPRRLKITNTGTDDHVLIDVFTASAVKQVFEAINDKNKEKLNSVSFLDAVHITWKIFGKTH